MSVKLDVRNLNVTFWTNTGTVQAVRNIDFQLNEGETLAIVGESGSGKSVTAKTIMGILAPNATIGSGEIIYNGMDILQLSEDQFHDLRGNEIAMIFQDPLSSLNPIVRVGKQLTEAMEANNITRRKRASKEFQAIQADLKQGLARAYEHEGLSSQEASHKANHNVDRFAHLLAESGKESTRWQLARDFFDVYSGNLEDVRVNLIGGTPEKVVTALEEVNASLTHIAHPLVVNNASEIESKISQLLKDAKQLRRSDDKALREQMLTVIVELQKQIEEIRASVDERPDFLAMGYANMNGKTWADDASVRAKINSLRQELDESFFDSFSKDLELAIRLSMDDSVARKQQALEAMSEAYDGIGETISNHEAEQLEAKLTPLVNQALNNLDVGKDSAAMIFAPALENAIRELKKFRQLSKLREGKKRRKKFRKAKLSETTSEAILTQNIKSIINRAMISFGNYIEDAEHIEYAAYTQCFLAKLENLARDKDYKLSGEVAKERAVRYLDEVGIPQPRERFRQYPFELSGGMRQRVVIAIALSSNPDVLICDEPTTALDVTIQAQILDLINDLKAKRNLSVIFITHDLGVVANVSDRIAVMYAGKIVEYGTSEEVFYNPQHPYTWALLASMPDLETKDKLQSIPGTPPDMTFPPKGDAFAARNPYAMEIDFQEQPPLIKISDTHYAATWLLHPDAPKVEPPEIVTNRIKRMTGQNYGEVTLHVPDEEA